MPTNPTQIAPVTPVTSPVTASLTSPEGTTELTGRVR